MTDFSNPSATKDIREIGEQVAARWADDVDRGGRFPSEAVEALRASGLLGALIPVELGGHGATLSEIAAGITELGRSCASTGMIFAMHQIQVACLVRHGRNDVLKTFIRRVATEQLLLASATTEIGIGGDARTSTCAVEVDGTRFRLSKNAPVISYGQHAAAVLATARSGPDSPPNDQSLVLCTAPELVLEPTSGWDTLGFRGTCSLGFQLSASGPTEQILDDGYGDISTQTMLPVSHIVWASLWLGIALAAADRARRYVQAQARKNPGTTPPGAIRLAELTVVLQQFSESVSGLTRRYSDIAGDPDALSSIGFTIAMNALKINASELVVDVVHRALLICGISGYKNDSPFSLTRLLRDAQGAALMVNNDRIMASNAQLLLVQRDR